MSRGLPPRVRKFILAHVHSVAQLEVLLWFRETPRGPVTTQDVADEHRIAVDMARSILEDLCARGFIDKTTHGQNPTYSFASTSTLSEQLEALGRAYKTHRVALIHLIYSKPSEEVRGFANTFRIRKDEPDG